MSNKREIFDIETKCRLCLGEEGFMSYLFDDVLYKKLENITKCTSIDIKENEELPNKVCHVCIYKLDMWNDFKEQFLKSNQLLLAHLELVDGDDINSETINPKRKLADARVSGEVGLSETVTIKKLKQEEITPLKNAPDNEEALSSKENLDEEVEEEENEEKDEEEEQEETSASNLLVEDEEKENGMKTRAESLENQDQSILVSTRMKQFGAKRGKMARRKASTKRWVARKRALLAATGDYASDTDSIISDNESKLSPVQKARAKTNADKEVEKQKRLAKALKNLETDMKGEYGIKYDSDSIMIPGSDSEANKHKTRSQKKLVVEKVATNESKSLTNSVEKKINADSVDEKEETTNEKGNRESTLEERKGLGVDIEEENIENTSDLGSVFNSQPIKSELDIGDAIYIVTSTLVLSEANYLGKTNVQNFTKDANNLNTDENSQERNTDIIDAVQLRRIIPKSVDESDEKRVIERCLNIEVEGTELESLQKVQAELAAFVEKDMKNKLCNKDMHGDGEVSQNKPKDSFQTLDQQLKAIVETAIRKNIETSSKLKKVPATKVRRKYRNQKVSTFSPAFVKAAMRSKIFQPKVLLMRLDLGKVRKRYKINNIALMEYKKSNNQDMGNERQTDSPLEYHRFNLASLDTDETITSDDEVVTSTPKVYKNNSQLMSEAAKTNKLLVKKLSGPKGRKKLSLSEQVLYAIRKGLAKDLALKKVEKPVCETVECDTTTKSLPLQPVTEKPPIRRVQFSKSLDNQSIKLEEIQRKHICGICDKTFASLDEKEKHLKCHKPVSPFDQTSKSKKPRMMRCKRCHEIVDARLVRVHTCRSAKLHKCYVCNSTFRSEKMLVSHLETHDESEFNIENIERGQNSKKVVTTVTSTQGTIAQRAADSNTTTTEYYEKEKVLTKEEYTCFVCDKKFTDEEILKDHLQQHCNDVTEDDASSGKEQYQCAICGDTLETEDALESHLEKHMCDDEDDNPNLINISNDSDHNKKETEELFKCSQCAKEFDSDISLALHMQAHEEELAIEEWQKQSTDVVQTMEQYYICSICEETFENEDEFSAHLDVHNSNAHVCFLCDRPFLSLEELQTHVASH